jgi:magnesium transporter
MALEALNCLGPALLRRMPEIDQVSDAIPEIRSLIASRDFVGLRSRLEKWLPPDLADLISLLTPVEEAAVFRILPRDKAADVFEYLSVESQTELLHAMGTEEAVGILNEMSPDDRTSLLEELPAAAVTQLLRLLSPEERRIAQALLNYPEASVGRLMTPDYLAISDQWTVAEVLEHVRRNGRDSETLNVLYVVDERGRLIDDVRIREFLLQPLTKRVAEIRSGQPRVLRATDSEETAVALFRKYDRTILPVVDANEQLVGIVTVDDVLDVAEESSTEDIHMFGGVQALEQPYLSMSWMEIVRKRGVWLVALFFGGMLTAEAMGRFEDGIARAVVLAIFVPLIISSGGNSGSQAATLIIRAMALGEVQLRDWWQVMRREMVTGMVLGLILGSLGFIRVAFGGVDMFGEHWMLVGATVGFSLVGVVLWGSLSGSMLPFVLRRAGIDPATSSAPFVATLVDVTGILIYFTIAYRLLTGTLL